MIKKNVLITGSSYGIGFGIAKNFESSNYNIIITSRNLAKLKIAKKLISKIALRTFVILKTIKLLIN